MSRRRRGRLSGNFTPVLWENLADPIMTGREELGFAKIYAEMPPPVVIGDTYSAIATWQGFRFFEIEASDLDRGRTRSRAARPAVSTTSSSRAPARWARPTRPISNMRRRTSSPPATAA